MGDVMSYFENVETDTGKICDICKLLPCPFENGKHPYCGRCIDPECYRHSETLHIYSMRTDNSTLKELFEKYKICEKCEKLVEPKEQVDETVNKIICPHCRKTISKVINCPGCDFELINGLIRYCNWCGESVLSQSLTYGVIHSDPISPFITKTEI